MVSFLTSLKLENYAQVASFFNELEIKKPCSKTSVSFFNEVASEMQKLSSKPLFHFLTRLPQRCKNYPQMVSFLTSLKLENYAQVVSFFNELEIKKPC
jgi:hypothetical protein